MFAEIVLNDTYTMDNAASGSGTISMWTNRTILELSDFAAAVQGYEMSGTGILDMPRHYTLALPSLTTFNVVAAGTSRNITLTTDTEAGHNERMIVGEARVEHRRDGLNGTSANCVIHNRGRIWLREGSPCQPSAYGVYGETCSDICNVKAGIGAANITILTTMRLSRVPCGRRQHSNTRKDGGSASAKRDKIPGDHRNRVRNDIHYCKGPQAHKC